MKRLMLTAALVAIAMTGFAQNNVAASFQPKEGYVPNAETAVKIAEAVLIPVYGQKKIAEERPFKAALQGDVWTVTGTLHCGTPHCVGGTAEVKISKKSGEILNMAHYK